MGKSQASKPFCKTEQINNSGQPQGKPVKADQIFISLCPSLSWCLSCLAVLPPTPGCLDHSWASREAGQGKAGHQKLKLNTQLSGQVVLEQAGAVDSLICFLCDKDNNTDNDDYSISQGYFRDKLESAYTQAHAWHPGQVPHQYC